MHGDRQLIGPPVLYRNVPIPKKHVLVLVCFMGEDAARMFYEPGRFTRQGAMPLTTVRLLQDKGSVQLLDGAAHRHRKQMFIDMMAPGQMRRLREATEHEWQCAIEDWQSEDEVVLFDVVHELLCRTACAWADVPLSDDEARQRTQEFAAMLEGAGSIGPRSASGCGSAATLNSGHRRLSSESALANYGAARIPARRRAITSRQ